MAQSQIRMKEEYAKEGSKWTTRRIDDKESCGRPPMLLLVDHNVQW